MKDFFKLLFKFTGIMLFIMLVIFIGVYTYSRVTGNSIEFEGTIFEAVTPKETKNILVAALHTEGPLTDFIMVVQYNPTTKRVSALSIPRDTKVIGSIDGKINSSYAKRKKMDDLIDRVQEVTSVPIDNYILLETKVVAEMVDAVGGITYDVPFDMKYDDNSQNLHINILKGKQTLDGENVVKFLRFRKNNDKTIQWGDIQRIDLQQDFIKEAVKQVVTPEIIPKLPELIKLGLSMVKTDISYGEMIKYANDVLTFNMDNLRMEVLPGEAGYVDGLSYYIADTKKTITLVEELFFNDEIAEEINENDNIPTSVNVKSKTENKDDVTIEVLNSTTTTGLAAKVSRLLKEDNYNITKTGNYKATDKQKTKIINRGVSESFVKELKQELGIGIIVKEEKNTSSDVDITIIIGDDY
ncbi:MAG: LytR family transcriptional regulator [Clostridiales bacterium]|nr:LytR family transcriptional regulator [Clostridiales bacterium]